MLFFKTFQIGGTFNKCMITNVENRKRAWNWISHIWYGRILDTKCEAVEITIFGQIENVRARSAAVVFLFYVTKMTTWSTRRQNLGDR
jgi:hypothetical protein